MKKLRSTKDGKKCKKYWDLNGVLQYGCSLNMAPDSRQGEEWCKIAPDDSSKDDGEWGYCMPDLDMD